MYFYFKYKRGEKLSNYHDAARELEYQVKRTDDPEALRVGNRIAHAAKVRAEGQIVSGATQWNPEKRWNHKEIE
jgi:hypothetical protein